MENPDVNNTERNFLFCVFFLDTVCVLIKGSHNLPNESNCPTLSKTVLLYRIKIKGEKLDYIKLDPIPYGETQ